MSMGNLKEHNWDLTPIQILTNSIALSELNSLSGTQFPGCDRTDKAESFPESGLAPTS